METPMFLTTSLSLGVGLAKSSVQDFLHTGMVNSRELFDQPNAWGPTLFWCLYSFWFLFRTTNLNLGGQVVLGRRGTLAKNLISEKAL